MDRTKIEQILKENGYEDFKWISGKDVVVSQWPRFKCMYGCSSYGKKGSCPPSVPSVAECREFFSEYEHIAVIHFQKKLNKPEGRKDFSRKTNAKLLKLERATFLAGHPTYAVDVSIAFAYMLLQAYELGLGTCWIGAFKEDEVKSVLGVPKDVRVVALSPLGYPATDAGARSRKRLDEITCFEAY